MVAFNDTLISVYGANLTFAEIQNEIVLNEIDFGALVGFGYYGPAYSGSLYCVTATYSDKAYSPLMR